MGFFSLYIIIMSDDDEDYLDDPEILDFNENLDARAAEAQEENDPGEAFGVEMFGPTGRGSPAMGHQSPYQLSRNAAASLRNAGFKDEKHLKDITAWEPQPQPKSKPQPQPKPKAVKAAKAKATPLQANRNQFYDNDKYDRDAQVAADKFWLSMGHLPLRHRVGEEYEKMMQERARPQRNKGGTRKRNTRRRNKRSIRRNKSSSRKSSSRRNKSRK
jgi:hypothetical protein